MKNSFSKLVLVGSFLLITAGASFAQTSANATASASANIIQPIAITKDADMNFGSLIPGASAGTLALATDGTLTPTGVTVVTSAHAAASFTATGQSGVAYTITLPSSAVTITRVSGSETMTIDNFVSDPAAGTATFDGSGTQIINVGATLNVGASQVAGSYTNLTGIQVTVNYN